MVYFCIWKFIKCIVAGVGIEPTVLSHFLLRETP
jgi:hypothetical protein